jgi:hypothetical protein
MAGAPLRLAEQDHQLAAPLLVHRAFGTHDERGRLLVERHRFVVGQAVECEVTGAAKELDCLGGVATDGAVRVVARQLGQVAGEVARVARLDGRAGTPVCSRTPSVRQLVEQNGAHDVVGEPVAGRRRLEHQPRFHRFVEHAEQGVVVQVGDVAEYTDVELDAENGRQPQHIVRGVPETGQAATDHLAHALGHAGGGEVGGHDPRAFVGLERGAGFGQVAERLADEERVAVRLRMDEVGQRLARGTERSGRGRRDERHRLVLGQPGENDSIERRHAAEVGQQFVHGVGALELAIAVGADDQ